MAGGIRLRKGDEVMVITGKDRGKRGRVQEVRPRDQTVVVAGVNIAKHHTKPNPAKNQRVGSSSSPCPSGSGRSWSSARTAESPPASRTAPRRTPRSASASDAVNRSSWSNRHDGGTQRAV